MSCKRLLLLNTNLAVGGAERQLLHVARYLDRSRWEVSVLVLEKQGLFCKDLPDDVKLHALSEHLPESAPGKLSWSLRQAGAVREFLRANNFDAVLTFLWLPSLLCALALRGLKRRPKFVWSVQSDLEADFASRWLGGLRSLLVKRYIPPQVAHYIAISEGVAGKITKVLRIPLPGITIIPNAIDLTVIDKLKEEKPADLKNKAPGRLRLISVGRLAPQKAHHDLLAGFAEACKSSAQDLELVILGEGPERNRLESLIAELGIEGRVFLPGVAANPYAWMYESDAFVLASAWEPFGIVITEALAAGLPVITTATDGGKDIVGSSGAGIMVPVGDKSALSRAILSLVSAPEKRAALGRKARERAKDFDAAAIVPLYDTVLKQVTTERINDEQRG
ncbi:MAG: glycosyltransferase [Bacillota bacterium]